MEYDMNAELFMAELTRGSPVGAGRNVPMSIRTVVDDFTIGRLRFNLPFQRKGVWKISQKEAWISALFRNVMPDPIAVSKRDTDFGTDKRGINGGNRIRAIASFMNNEFSISLTIQERKYNMWWLRVPEVVTPRNARFHFAMPAAFRERFLEKELHFHIREGLTDEQEKSWYREMNKNMVAHSKGHLLIVHLCDPANVFAAALLRMFPILKARIMDAVAPEDAVSLYEFIVDTFDLGEDQELKPNDDADTNEDVPLALARIFNMLVNGSPYNDEFKGDFDGAKLAENEQKMRDILGAFRPSPEMKLEMSAPSSSKKKRLPNAYAPAYLLGPIAWSIGTDKPDVVNTWRRFLANVSEGVIRETYARANNDVHKDDANSTKYSFAWEAVQAYVARLPVPV